MPNGGVALVTHTGSCTISNVLHLPQFKYNNLLSVLKETKQLNCSATFLPNFCVFHDIYSGKVKGIGRERDVLYYLLSHHKLPGHKKSTCGFSVKKDSSLHVIDPSWQRSMAQEAWSYVI